MKREHVHCLLCDSELYTVIGSGQDFEYNTSDEEFDVVQCESCGFIYLQDRPSLDEFEVIYPSNYYSYFCVSHELKHPANSNSLAARFRKAMYQRNFRKVLRFLPGYDDINEVRILDIGCGDGRLLNWFKEMNLEKHKTYGIDNDEMSKEIAERNGHTFFLGLFDKQDFRGVNFHVILANHVVEHVPNPRGFCLRVKELLEEGGVFTFDTPNIDSWEWKFVQSRYWGGYHFPRHWSFFNARTATELLARSGFLVKAVEYYPNPVIHNWTIHHYLSEKKYLKYLTTFFPPVKIFYNSLYSFILLSIFTVFDIIGQKMSRKTPGNMKLIAQKKG